MKWCQKYHAASAILQYFIIWFHIPVGASQHTTTRLESPDTCSIGPTLARYQPAMAGWQVLCTCMCVTRLFQYVSVKSWENRFKWRWGSDRPSGHNKSAGPHTPVLKECLPWRNKSVTLPTSANYHSIWATVSWNQFQQVERDCVDKEW